MENNIKDSKQTRTVWLIQPNSRFLFSSQFLNKPPSSSQVFSALPEEEHLFYDKLTVISEELKNQCDEIGAETGKTTEHLQDSEQEDSDSRIVPASEKA